MRGRLTIEVTFDEQRGYVASHPDLPSLNALSLAMLRRRIEDKLVGEDVDIRLMLDRKAREERARRASGGHGGREQWRDRR